MLCDGNALFLFLQKSSLCIIFIISLQRGQGYTITHEFGAKPKPNSQDIQWMIKGGNELIEVTFIVAKLSYKADKVALCFSYHDINDLVVKCHTPFLLPNFYFINLDAVAGF